MHIQCQNLNFCMHCPPKTHSVMSTEELERLIITAKKRKIRPVTSSTPCSVFLSNYAFKHLMGHLHPIRLTFNPVSPPPSFSKSITVPSTPALAWGDGLKLPSPRWARMALPLPRSLAQWPCENETSNQAILIWGTCLRRRSGSITNREWRRFSSLMVI